VDIAASADLQPTAVAIIGAMPDWLPNELRACSRGEVIPDAQAMISTARSTHAEGRSVSAEFALPIYVQGDSPWRKRQSGATS
jgi:hypothetical protein